MGKIFKRRNRRPLVVRKGSVRRTPNFYPQFYGDGGPVDMHGSGFGSLREASDALRRGNVYSGTVNVRTGFKKNSGGTYDTQSVGAMDVMSSGMAALQGAEQITKGGMDLAEIADTSAVQDQIDDAFDEDFDGASDNESLLASFGNAGNLRQDWSAGDVRGMSTGEGVVGIFANAGAGAAAGAAAGSLAGPFGTGVGAAAGFVTGLGAGIGGFLAGNRRAKRQAEHLNSQAEAANRYALNAFDSANQNLAERNWRGNLFNLSAYGGDIDTGEDVNENEIDMERDIYVPRNAFAGGGGIHIDPKNRGKFTEAASRAGMGVQEYARHVLANSGDYDATTVRRANFARNAAKWGHAYGGAVRGNRYGGDGRGLTINGASVGGGGLGNVLKGILNGISYSLSKPSAQAYDVERRIAAKSDPRYANRSGINFSLSDGFSLSGINPGVGYNSVMSLVKPQGRFSVGRRLVSALPYGAENLELGLPQPYGQTGYGVMSGEPTVYRSAVGPYSDVPAGRDRMFAFNPPRRVGGRLVGW